MDYYETFMVPEPSEEDFQKAMDLIEIINDLHTNDKDFQKELNSLSSLLPDEHQVKVEDILEYWETEDLDALTIKLLLPEPNFKDLKIDALLWIIMQIMDNLHDEFLMEYYSSIIQQNIPSNIDILDLILFEEIEDPEEILDKLRSSPK